MTMSNKTWIARSALLGLVAVAGLGYWWQHPGSTATAQGAQAAQAAQTARPASATGANPTSAPAPGGPVAVEVGQVQRLSLADDAQAVGSLRARQAVVLRPEVSGRVVKLAFVDGQRVRRGQVLVQLDDSLQAAQLQQAQAQAGIARTQLQRSRELLAQGFVSTSAVDQADANLKVAEAQVALAQAQAQRMQVRAPFDGVTGIRSVNLGDFVKDGADLVSVEDASAMWVDFRLPERFVTRLRAGQEVEMSLDAVPGTAFTGRIEALDSQLDANGRSLLVRARVANPGGELRSGLFARVRVVFALRSQALVVPEEALVPLGGKQYVFKLTPPANGAKGPGVQRIEARLGMRVPGKVELLAGVQEGDRVVTAGQQRLLRGDGQVLKVVNLEAPASASAPAGAKPGNPGNPGTAG